MNHGRTLAVLRLIIDVVEEVLDQFGCDYCATAMGVDAFAMQTPSRRPSTILGSSESPSPDGEAVADRSECRRLSRQTSTKADGTEGQSRLSADAVSLDGERARCPTL